ncbi:MAG: hypothetical protein CME70_06115 [Halobacteriovorax sp.]|nr:hypothetical protein [Halobacteriovorax sp.]
MGKSLGTIQPTIIYNAVETGQIKSRRFVLKESDRLDIIAGRVYGNARLWWVIAAASGIGWSMQVPPGTSLRIPTNINEVAALVS